MFRKKSLFALPLLAAITLAIPAAAQNAVAPAACVPGSGQYATLSTSNVQMVIVGSSAMWQSIALGAYNNGYGVSGVATQPTFHYVSTSNFSLVDERPTVIGGTATSDGGKVWIVWDSRVTSSKCNPRVWIYMNVDSVIGNRAFFGSIGVGAAGNGVYVQAPAAWPADDGGSQINSHLWVCTNTDGTYGAACPAAGQYAPGVVPDAAVQALFSNGTTKASQLVTVGATDIRPEDAYFAVTRVNSALDPNYNAAPTGPTGPGISGLGYNSNNAAGTNPGLSTNCGGTATAADLVGSGIHGNYPGDATFNVVSFNVQGEDPFTCNNIGNPVVIPVGALAVVVLHSSNGGQLGAAPVATTTSAQVTEPATSIPVTTATGMVVGETVTIAGAGAAGGTYTGQITAISGCPGACTLTTATATSTTVAAGAAVNALGYNLLSDATTYELEQVFSGQKNGAGSFANCPTCTGSFGVVLREPLSGTFNTFEETTMRHPSAISTYRASQEYKVNGATNNPLSGFDGIRWRAIGTGDMVKSVRDMAAGANSYTVNSGHDAIGYAFFSFGNVSTIADNSKYSYITLNGIDPIWHNYTNAPVYSGGPSDPGQTAVFNDPAAGAQLPGTLPGEQDLPATCAGGGAKFPCNESNLWAADNFSVVEGAVNPATGNPYPSYSFPNLRNGTYPAWSVVRLMATSTNQSAVQNLVNTSNSFVVTTTPDYVPYDQVPAGDTGAAVIDPGMQFLRSHFGCTAATCGTNSFTGNANVEANIPTELGRDAGGAILDKSDSTIDLAQDGPEDTWVIAFE